jgi:ribosome biogenesis protein ENP2
MKLSTNTSVPVYTVSGSSTARPLPEWLIRKRKRSLKHDPEFAGRVELLQEFAFEEASCCVRVSEDGDWVMSTGTYKPQMHTHYLPHLSLSWARHTSALNQTFLFLSSDYSKSIHLQSDRFLEFHTPSGCHYSTRIPRYGRDLQYDRQSAEVLIPAVGVNADGSGEVFRLNLEQGRFMKGYEVDVGGDDYSTIGGGSLQGGVHAGSVNVAAVAERSHNLLAFGTSSGTVEFFDSRSRHRVSALAPPADAASSIAIDGTARPEITALEFHSSGLTLATGNSTGLVYLYDLRSPVPLLKKDQGYGYPIQNLIFLEPTTSSARAHTLPENKILSADKRIIKIWDSANGKPWTSVEPAVDLNHVAWCPDSGMFLTANEGQQQHAFFIPQLGPAPRWCSFLDNIVEEMAEDVDDPAAFNGFSKSGAVGGGEVYDNYKFLTTEQLKVLNLDHLIGTTSLLRPYMHGFFVAQRLYEEARLIANPDLWQEQRAKSIREKIAKERESRIRGNKKIAVKVNRQAAERLLEREEKNERRKARRVLKKGGDDDVVDKLQTATPVDPAATVDNDPENADSSVGGRLLSDPRFARFFQDEDFAIDETSAEFRALNPGSKPTTTSRTSIPKGLTAVEEEENASDRSSSIGDESDSDNGAMHRRRNQSVDEEEEDNGRISSANYRRKGKPQQQQRQKPKMLVSSSTTNGTKARMGKDRSFESRMKSMGGSSRGNRAGASNRTGGGVVGERQISFAPGRHDKRKGVSGGSDAFESVSGRKERRSASGNTFRKI